MEPGAQDQCRERQEADPKGAATPGDCPATIDVPASEMSAALAEIVARRTAEMKAAVEADFARWLAARQSGRLAGDCLLHTMYETPGLPSAPVDQQAGGPNGREFVQTRGRLKWLSGCHTVWLDDNPYGLRDWQKARACLEYLVEQQAFCEATGRHLVDEIDPFVRAQSGLPPAPHSTVKIQDYFKDGGPLRELCREIVKPVSGDGRYFLKVD